MAHDIDNRNAAASAFDISEAPARHGRSAEETIVTPAAHPEIGAAAPARPPPRQREARSISARAGAGPSPAPASPSPEHGIKPVPAAQLPQRLDLATTPSA